MSQHVALQSPEIPGNPLSPRQIHATWIATCRAPLTLDTRRHPVTLYVWIWEDDLAEWRTDAPPLDRDVEFERDGRLVEKGRLTSTPVQSGTDYNDMKRQYRLNDEGVLFEVTRWREPE